MSLFQAMAALLPNCELEIVNGCANRYVGAPSAIARIISLLFSGTDEKMRITSLRNLLIVFIIRTFVFSKSIFVPFKHKHGA